MNYINIFIDFLDSFLSFEILGFSILDYLITVSLVLIGFQFIHKMIKTKE